MRPSEPMSASKAIVILANSVRSGHRCVAGKELIRDGDGWEVGPWIRLTDPGTKDGSVRYELTRCRGGEEAQVDDQEWRMISTHFREQREALVRLTICPACAEAARSKRRWV